MLNSASYTKSSCPRAGTPETQTYTFCRSDVRYWIPKGKLAELLPELERVISPDGLPPADAQRNWLSDSQASRYRMTYRLSKAWEPKEALSETVYAWAKHHSPSIPKKRSNFTQMGKNYNNGIKPNVGMCFGIILQGIRADKDGPRGRAIAVARIITKGTFNFRECIHEEIAATALADTTTSTVSLNIFASMTPQWLAPSPTPAPNPNPCLGHWKLNSRPPTKRRANTVAPSSFAPQSSADMTGPNPSLDTQKLHNQKAQENTTDLSISNSLSIFFVDSSSSSSAEDDSTIPTMLEGWGTDPTPSDDTSSHLKKRERTSFGMDEEQQPLKRAAQGCPSESGSEAVSTTWKSFDEIFNESTLPTTGGSEWMERPGSVFDNW